MLLSVTIRAHRKIKEAGGIADLKEAGGIADLNVYEGVSHGEFLIYAELPENAQVYTELGEFLDTHLK